jgi:integrase
MITELLSTRYSGVSVNVFDVRIYTIRRRKGRRRPFEVRWQAAGRAKSKSFLTRGLADRYRAELVRAARQGLEFKPDTGEPLPWSMAGRAAATWLEHAVAYADMKWPHLAPHSRASLADALATVTAALTRPAAGRPPARTLRAALYRHLFNPQRHAGPMDPAEARAIEWLARASLPVGKLSDTQVVRGVLDAMTVRLDGSRAAAATVARKRAVFHDALGYAVELGLLPANPVSQVRWAAPTAATAGEPADRCQPREVRAILAEVARLRPELTAFFGCLYYAALRPEEAVALRQADLILPPHGRGKLILTGACPRTGSAWTSTGTPHSPRCCRSCCCSARRNSFSEFGPNVTTFVYPADPPCVQISALVATKAWTRDHNGRCFTHRVRASVNASGARPAIPGWLWRLCVPWPRAETARLSWSAPACAGCRTSRSRA